MPDKTGARYRLIEEIGCGAFGTVYLAHDNLLERDVAIKMMEIPKGTSEEEKEQLLERFQREARAVASLSTEMGQAGVMIGELKQKGFPLDYLEAQFDAASRNLAGAGSATAANIYRDYALSVISRCEAQ